MGEELVLPEGFTQDDSGRIFNAEGVEYDAALEPKKEGVVYGADNLPMPDEEVEKMGLKQGEVGLDPTDENETVMGSASDEVGQIPVSFTETKQTATGEDYTYQHPEIRKDGHLLISILPTGHNYGQQLVNCLFDDGTTKHVSIDELHASGIDYELQES